MIPSLSCDTLLYSPGFTKSTILSIICVSLKTVSTLKNTSLKATLQWMLFQLSIQTEFCTQIILTSKMNCSLVIYYNGWTDFNYNSLKLMCDTWYYYRVGLFIMMLNTTTLYISTLFMMMCMKLLTLSMVSLIAVTITLAYQPKNYFSKQGQICSAIYEYHNKSIGAVAS